MMNTRDDLSLSGVELLVLARLSSAKPPSERELAEAVLELALPTESPARAREVISHTLAALRRRALLSTQRRALTEDGARALRAAFDLERTPTWSEVRDAHLPALALGLPPGFEAATTSLRDAEAITVAVLRAHFGIPRVSTLRGLCDALVAEAFGLPPGPVTLAHIHAHVLARCAGIETTEELAQIAARVTAAKNKGELERLAARLAAANLGARRADKRSMGRALGRRWVYEVRDPQSVRRTQLVQLAQPVPPELPVHAGLPVPQVLAVPVDTPPLPAPVTETLLTLVREAIPTIGSDGRFGLEKVFVSAIWHCIERDRRALDLSLDRFKRWLVIANRDRLLDLARADLVGAMDAKLVAESEIEDLGATFHFVLDRRAMAPGSGKGIHAR